jgi:hypothetical protein
MNTARLLVPIFTLRDFLYLLLDFLLAGFVFYSQKQEYLRQESWQNVIQY